MSAPIQVLAIRQLGGRTNVKAFVDVRLGAVTIKGTKIVQQEGQPAWLAMPSIKGNNGWLNVVELSKEPRRAQERALALARQQRARVPTLCDTAKQALAMREFADPRLPHHRPVSWERAEAGAWGLQ